MVIQVGGVLFPAFGFGDAAVRIVTIILAIGLIPTLILSWAFEITPEGLKKEKDVDRSQPFIGQSYKQFDRMIMVVLALALGYFAFDKFVLNPQREAAKDEQVAGQVVEAREQGRSEALVESYGEKSIAVLPFVDMSIDKDQEYMSDGIAEELLNLLAKVPELRVVSRSSAFSYKDKDVNLSQVAQELNVAHILEGSVRKAGNQLRITVQLIEARSDTHLWSKTYNHTLEDIFLIQDEIASSVVKALKVTLFGVAPTVEKTDPEAFALVLQALHFYGQQTPEGMDQALNLLKKALAIDPDYARAWTEMARTYSRQVVIDQMSIQEGEGLILDAIDHALTINPEFAPAHVELGWHAMAYENDLSAAAIHYQRAMDLDPSSTLFASTFLFDLGRLDEAIALQKENVLRDPVNSSSHYNLGLFYCFGGYLDNALNSLRNALKLSPGRVNANAIIGLTLLLKNEPQAALEAFAEEKREIYRVKGTAIALHDLGRKSDFANTLGELEERWGEEWPSEIAEVYAWVGDNNAAFQWMEKEIEVNGTFGWSQTPQNPYFRNLHNDSRWQVFLGKVGVSAKQLASIEFRVDLPK